jgi:prepilin-type N-terminal cleavage/methylation domain-containing protein
MAGQRGISLIEVVLSLVILGIVGTIVGLTFTTGVKGFITVRNNEYVALKAQIALTRMGLELRDLASYSAYTANTSLTFTNSAGATRVISYDAGTGQVRLQVGGTNYPLVDGVSAFTLAVDVDNLDTTGGNEVKSVAFGFTMSVNNTAFSDLIYPRSQQII